MAMYGCRSRLLRVGRVLRIGSAIPDWLLILIKAHMFKPYAITLLSIAAIIAQDCDSAITAVLLINLCRLGFSVWTESEQKCSCNSTAFTHQYVVGAAGSGRSHAFQRYPFICKELVMFRMQEQMSSTGS